MLLIIGFWVFMFRNIANRQGLGGMVNIGKSRARVYVERDTGVTFKDVAGIDEAKAELQEIVSFLKDQPRYGRLGRLSPASACAQSWVRRYLNDSSHAFLAICQG